MRYQNVRLILHVVAGVAALAIAIALPIERYLSGERADTNLLQLESQVIAKDITE